MIRSQELKAKYSDSKSQQILKNLRKIDDARKAKTREVQSKMKNVLFDMQKAEEDLPQNQDYDYNICNICYIEAKEIAFGCGHCTCEKCAQIIQETKNKCPYCKKDIVVSRNINIE